MHTRASMSICTIHMVYSFLRKFRIHLNCLQAGKLLDGPVKFTPMRSLLDMNAETKTKCSFGAIKGTQGSAPALLGSGP